MHRAAAALLSLQWALLHAGMTGALAFQFTPHRLKAQAAIRRPHPSASCTVSLQHLPPHKRQHLAVRYAETMNNDGSYDGQLLMFSQFPEDVFAQISSGKSTIGFDDLTKWQELQELLEDGELFLSELQTFYDKTVGVDGLLDKAGFVALYKMIDDLFEDVGEENNIATSATPAPASVNKEEELISFLANGMTTLIDDLPCGLECKDAKRNEISDLVSEIVADDNNDVATMQAKDMIGTWELLYTSSQAMIRNRSLSGLTVTDDNIRFSAVLQTFTGSKFLGFVEFVETYTRNNNAEDCFNVKITGEWMLQEDTRTLQSCGIKIDPENIEYDAMNASGMAEAAPVVQMGGGVSQVADWQSLGPIKLLDIIYATPDIYIGRGPFDASILFVWRKVKQ